MKKFLKISNNGLLNPDLIPLMGGTTKEEKQTIGEFGTGLKYAIAYFLRNDIEIVLFVGKRQIKITKVDKTIEGIEYGIIVIDGKETSITTKMGKDWKLWMCIREIYSNAIDEGNESYNIDENFDVIENQTSFFIEATPHVLEIYNNWNNYFINKDTEPIYICDEYKLYAKSGPLRIYKQGILVYEGNEDSIFNYNINDVRINELRELRYSADHVIVDIIPSISDTHTIEYLFEMLREDSAENGKSKFAEGNLDYSFWNCNFNPAFNNVIGNAKIIHAEAANKIKGSSNAKGLEDAIIIPKRFYIGLTKKFAGISVLRSVSKIREFYEIYDEKLDAKIKKGLKLLEQCGYFIHPELEFVYGDFEDKRVLAQVDTDDKTIFISTKMLDKPMFNIVAMLIEENEHYQTGLADESRGFQQHFIDLYTKKLLELNNVEV